MGTKKGKHCKTNGNEKAKEKGTTTGKKGKNKGKKEKKGKLRVRVFPFFASVFTLLKLAG